MLKQPWRNQYQHRIRPSLRILADKLETLSSKYAPPTLLLQRVKRNAAREGENAAQAPMSFAHVMELERMKVSLSSHINNRFRTQMKTDTGSEAVYPLDVMEMHDVYEWGFNAPFLWRISAEECVALYDDCVCPPTAPGGSGSGGVRWHHCEIAVGTGLFLKNLTMVRNVPLRQLTLVDLNMDSLNATIARLSSEEGGGQGGGLASFTKVNSIIADISLRASIPNDMRRKCDSVGANFLFHCLHGKGFIDKRQAFLNCASLLNPDSGKSVFFGSTILGKDLMHNAAEAGEAAVQTLQDYNKWGIFANLGDSYEDLSWVLHEYFSDVEIWRSGYCAAWKARRPKSIISPFQN